MAQIEFFDKGHRYELEGVEIPSVSQILRFLTRETYGDVEQYALDTAADRGTRVHAATEALDKTGAVDCDGEILPYVQAYLKFLTDHVVTWHGIEEVVFNPQLRYAGTLDRRGIVDGLPYIVDMKAQASIHKTLVKAQLNAYYMTQDTPHHLAVLQLMKTGKYRFYEVAIDPTEFMACYDLHAAMKRRHTRGRID